MGLGYSKIPKETSFFNFIKSNYEYYQLFALDFTSNDAKMILGPELRTYQPYPLQKIIWSEIQFRDTDWLQTNAGLVQSLTIYDLKFCGADLFANYSSNWQASINTLIDGIAVPEEFYEMIISWISERNISSKFDPLIEFQLSPNSDAFKFQIPLSNLYDNETQKLHIYSSGKMKFHFSSKSGVPAGEPLIEIGTRFLQLYYTVFDVENHRIGFFPTKYDFKSSTCTSNEKKCFGLQEYYAPSNVCIDPPCSDYFFQTIDEKTKQCTFRLEFYFLFGILVLMFALAEIFLFEFYKRIENYIATSTP